MVRPRFGGFALLVSVFSAHAQLPEATGDFGSGESPPSSPPPPSPPPRPPWAPILCGAAGQPPCGRLVASGPNLLLDGAPFIARGVAYNPTPAGADRADYLADGNAAIWERDLPVLEALGANLLRVPPFAADGDHSAFLVEAGRRALTVMGEFPLVASDFDADGEFAAVDDDSGATTTVKDRLWAQLTALQANASAFAALTIWAVGSELNAEWAGLLCGPASAFAPCPFDAARNTTDLFEKVRARAPRPALAPPAPRPSPSPRRLCPRRWTSCAASCSPSASSASARSPRSPRRR